MFKKIILPISIAAALSLVACGDDSSSSPDVSDSKYAKPADTAIDKIVNNPPKTDCSFKKTDKEWSYYVADKDEIVLHSSKVNDKGVETVVTTYQKAKNVADCVENAEIWVALTDDEVYCAGSVLVKTEVSTIESMEFDEYREREDAFDLISGWCKEESGEAADDDEDDSEEEE